MNDSRNQTSTTQTTQTSETSTFSVPPAALANKIEDGGEYVLIRRGYGSEQPKVFSTGDREETFSWLQQVVGEAQPV